MKKISRVLVILLSTSILLSIFINWIEVGAEVNINREEFVLDGLMLEDEDSIFRAENWVLSMLEAPKSQGDGSTIQAVEEYDRDYVGEVEGEYSLTKDHEIIYTSPIDVTYPEKIPDNYRGVVKGNLREEIAGIFFVKAYLKVGSHEYDQSQYVTPVHVSEDGSWELDLSLVPETREGVWHFRLYRITTDIIYDTVIGEGRYADEATILNVNYPEQITDDYRGIVRGDTKEDLSGNYEVRAFLKVGNTEYDQSDRVSAGTLSQDGTWELDLSNVPETRNGSWRFGLYDTDAETKLGASWALDYTIPVTIDSPIIFPNQYRGIVTGTIKTQPEGKYAVKAFLKVGSTEYDQSKLAIPSEVGEDGTWSIDLSGIPDSRVGNWVFYLYQIPEEEQIGASWPGESYYKDLEFQSIAVTSAEYLIATDKVYVGDKWTSKTRAGEKMYRIVDTSTDEVLAEYFEPELSGLVRSYEYDVSDQEYTTGRKYISYLYDQATTLLTAVGNSDRDLADKLMNGLYVTQIKDGDNKGAFPAHSFQFQQADVKYSIWVGGNAFISYAMIRYYEKFGTNVAGISEKEYAFDTLSMINSNLDFLSRMKIVEGEGQGLYTGGYRNVEGELVKIEWSSTEHNTDLWHVFERAGRVIDSKYFIEAENLKNVILEKLWNEEEGRFNQGLNDPAKALDVNSWGSIFLNAIGETEKAESALQYSDNFKVSKNGTYGYTPKLNSEVLPIWYEGTFGVTLAQRINGNLKEAAEMINESVKYQNENGSFLYVAEADPGRQLIRKPSVASTNWFILTTKSPGVLWSERNTKKIKYMVTYHKDDSTTGEVPIDTNRYTLGSSVTILDGKTLKKEGYEFIGWSEEQDSLSADYLAGEQVKIEKNMDLYPIWKKVEETGGSDTLPEQNSESSTFETTSSSKEKASETTSSSDVNSETNSSSQGIYNSESGTEISTESKDSAGDSKYPNTGMNDNSTYQYIGYVLLLATIVLFSYHLRKKNKG